MLTQDELNVMDNDELRRRCAQAWERAADARQGGDRADELTHTSKAQQLAEELRNRLNDDE